MNKTQVDRQDTDRQPDTGRDAEGAAASARGSANGRQLREEVRPAIDALGEAAQGLATHGKALAQDAYEHTTEKLQDIHERTTAYVGTKPYQAMAFAAATGAALALVLGRRR